MTRKEFIGCDVCRRCMLGAAQHFDVCCGSDGKGAAGAFGANHENAAHLTRV